MQGSKLKVLLVALSLGAVTAAGAQTHVPATGDVADTAGRSARLDAATAADLSVIGACAGGYVRGYCGDYFNDR